jgi:Abortive infection C-terminus
MTRDVEAAVLIRRSFQLEVEWHTDVRAANSATPADDLGRSLTAAVQRLSELRNATGSGHGRATQPDVGKGIGRLAATGITLFLLDR